MTVHLGILGGGNISQTHARAAREIAGVEIVAVYGQNQEKAERLAELHSSRAYSEIESFLRHQPMEVVLVGSPSGLHAEQGIAAARRGLHVLVEKPIDITTERADALIAECERAGVKLGVFFQDRAAPDIRRLKALLDEGRLGKIILVSARVKWYRPPEYYRQSRWRGTWALDGGGALMNQGVHTVDLLWWLLGDVARVWGRAITALHDIEVEDTVVAALEFAGGAVGTLEAATSVYPGYARRIEITGAEGTVILENDRLIAADLRAPLTRWADEPERQDERAASPVLADVRGHRAIIEDFLRAISTGGTPLCDGRQARRSVELIQAIYQASSTRREINLCHP
jgi:UDP-N-acetyl-2-amino-2-deoxyglucuronate dehydrogenase